MQMLCLLIGYSYWFGYQAECETCILIITVSTLNPLPLSIEILNIHASKTYENGYVHIDLAEKYQLIFAKELK